MERYNPKRLNRAFLISLLLTGCATVQSPTATISPLASTPKPLNTEMSSPPTFMPEPTWTLPATLPAQDAASKVNKLLQTNGGCRLPCWWGITPGQTRWEDARNILFPLAKSVDDSYSEDGEFFPGLVVHYLTDHGTGFEQDYTVREGIVQEIKIKLPNDLNLFYSPKTILDEYGVPDEVYVGGNAYEPNVENDQYFSVVLYYTKQRIFVYYGGGFQPIQRSPSLLICFSEIEYAELHLWGSSYSFDETRNSVFEENGNRFCPIEEVTSLTIDEFFKRFTSPTETPCFETPAENWLP